MIRNWTFMKNGGMNGLRLLGLLGVALGMACFGGCSSDEGDENGGGLEAAVVVKVEAAPWYGSEQDAGATRAWKARALEAGEVTDETRELEAGETRAGGEMLTPVTLLVVPKDDDRIAKRISLEEGTEFSLSLGNGTYDLVAVCGLEADLIPALYSENIAVPAGTDFAVGTMSVTVANGICSPSTVNITAARQMAWLDLEITGVPTNVEKLNFYVRGLYETYSLDGGWDVSQSGKERFSQIALTKDGTSYKGGGIMVPCSSTVGVVFAAEATTAGGTTTLLTYTSSAALSAGVHLTQTLEFGNMMVVEGGIGLGGWTEKEDEGALGGGFGFSLGQQYFSQAATVVNVSADGKSLNVFPHRPMTVTLDEVKAWDFKHVPYTLSPEICVQRWAFPTSDASMRNVVYAISQIGWDAFDAQFRANGLAPIDRTATNILAYRDKTTGTFYVYDFANGQFQDVADESGEFLVYPLGIIQIAE